MIDCCFATLKQCYPGYIFTYMDNILIATRDDKHLYEKIMHAVLNMLKDQDFYLKLSKCLFHKQSINYLGIRIEGGHIQINPTKINGLTD